MLTGNIDKILPELTIKIEISGLLFEIILDDGFTGRYHIHKASTHSHSTFEVFLIRSGCGILYTENGEYVLEEGIYYIIAPGVYHRVKDAESNTFERYYLKFQFTSLSNEGSLKRETAELQNALNQFEVFSAKNAKQIINIIEYVHKEMQGGAFYLLPRLQAYFTLILTGFLNDIAPVDKMRATLPQKVNDDKRSEIIEDFFDNYPLPLTSTQLAHQLNICTRQLSRIMHAMYKCTFKQKLIDVRIEEAKRLLKNTAFSIEQVSECVGYTSVQNFYTVFRQKTGCTPMRYRKKL